MFRNNTACLINELIVLGESTTLFLESIRGDRLQVAVESQSETNVSGSQVIRRAVKLHFQTPDAPVLYCVSFLNKNMLTEEEYRRLMVEEQPIGILFQSLNDAASIKKRNVFVTQSCNSALAARLNVQSEMIFEKRYDYWVGDRAIGYICEFFNEESLDRV